VTSRALIFGVGGQDGAYLASHLLGLGYEVWGTSRDAHARPFQNLQRLGIADRVQVVSATLTDFRSVLQAIAHVEPTEVYNLAGQTSVGLSFEQPVETFESITVGTLNLLEAIRFTKQPIRFYNAASSECFGDTTGTDGADEQTPFRPRSPYAVAKAAAHWQVINHREAYGLHAVSGILFNHESPLRPLRFVTQKIVDGAVAIAAGEQDKLTLGNIEIRRDWGWAPEYVEAMHLMLQPDEPDDFVIATGETCSLEEFVRVAFELVGLDWRDHVITLDSLRRPTDIAEGRGDASKAREQLGWRARSTTHDVVRMMVDARRAARAGASDAATYG
jgi:GDPmannose 4,6-dehydratase